MRVAAFVSGGGLPSNLRGTRSIINCHIVDWYPTFSFLAGVDGTDNPPVPPLPIDPLNPAKDIYGNHSYPGVDGVNIWPLLMNPSTANRSSAHPFLVLSKEVIIQGQYKLLVGQNNGWPHGSDNGWKLAGPDGGWTGSAWVSPNTTFPCGATDLDASFSTLPGIPGQYLGLMHGPMFSKQPTFINVGCPPYSLYGEKLFLKSKYVCKIFSPHTKCMVGAT